jgi:hypothetical protein
MEVDVPCNGVLVPTKEAAELLHLRDFGYPQAKLDWEHALDSAHDDIEECLDTLDTVRILAEVRGKALEKVEAGHSTWEVVGWTALGLALGFGVGYLVNELK